MDPTLLWRALRPLPGLGANAQPNDVGSGDRRRRRFLLRPVEPVRKAILPGGGEARSRRASGRKSPLATKNLLEDTDGLRRPPFYPFLRGATQSISALSMR